MIELTLFIPIFSISTDSIYQNTPTGQLSNILKKWIPLKHYL